MATKYDLTTLEGAKSALNDYANASVDTNGYGKQAAGLYSDLANAKFSYNPATDATYNMYARQYKDNAQTAMKNTMAQGAALTGGYTNSWAQSNAQQAYDSTMAQLSSIIPNLRSNALNEYSANMSNKANAASGLYNLYSQDVSQANTNTNLAANLYSSLLAAQSSGTKGSGGGSSSRGSSSSTVNSGWNDNAASNLDWYKSQSKNLSGLDLYNKLTTWQTNGKISKADVYSILREHGIKDEAGWILNMKYESENGAGSSTKKSQAVDANSGYVSTAWLRQNG